MFLLEHSVESVVLLSKKVHPRSHKSESQSIQSKDTIHITIEGEQMMEYKIEKWEAMDLRVPDMICLRSILP